MNEATLKANTRLAREAWEHISKTKKPSVGSDGFCIYGGCGCAFSPAIRNHCMADELGDSAGFIIIRRSYLLFDWALNCEPVFSNEVQDSHDHIQHLLGDEFVQAFGSSLAKVCAKYAVPTPESLDKYLESKA